MKKSITTLDLNLLLCLQLLMQERSVTKAAKRMNVTPSAVSKSLAKLRAWFDDPLFVNSPLGLSPTPLMVSMEQNLAEWMQMSNLLLATAPRYCQYYNQLHQLPLAALPLPFDESQQKKLEVPFTLLWHKRNSHNPKIVWLRETIKNLYASMA
ncbi:LysR family transcriptional regulator [Escherichia coli]